MRSVPVRGLTFTPVRTRSDDLPVLTTLVGLTPTSAMMIGIEDYTRVFTCTILEFTSDGTVKADRESCPVPERDDLQAVLVGGQVYAFGPSCADMWVYDVGTHVWSEVPPTPGCPFPLAQDEDYMSSTHPACFSVDGLLYVGGCPQASSETENGYMSLHVYDPHTAEWSVHPAEFPQLDFVSTVHCGGMMHVFGRRREREDNVEVAGECSGDGEEEEEREVDMAHEHYTFSPTAGWTYMDKVPYPKQWYTTLTSIVHSTATQIYIIAEIRTVSATYAPPESVLFRYSCVTGMWTDMGNSWDSSAVGGSSCTVGSEVSLCLVWGWGRYKYFALIEACDTEGGERYD
ncbi:hypothetical protein KIPB_009893 [Kipferlia bialata]|uniref:Uncharacterized protein n=1 Tax=Kipferlia bialata TaxID=797122 RepID=A0A9K3D5Q4_9EUKA|nr:hypothetical protein KIPB_009893 [Kipferlia bialata]|eukprot:g9893.t1